ncbi:MAG: hypothetical protein GY757_08275, partial [bacterium]|nr:hypothetical protein [bacterium]
MKKEKILRIESRSNPRVKSLIKKKELYLFEGQKLVSDLLKRNIAIETLIIHDKQKDILPGIPGVVKETWYVCENVLKKISRLKDNPAIIAVVELKKKNIDFRQAGVVIGLDNIQDPANAGTVFRCAAAFGIDAVAFSGASVRTTNPKFLRGAQDTFLDVDSQNFDSLAELIDSAS